MDDGKPEVDGRSKKVAGDSCYGPAGSSSFCLLIVSSLQVSGAQVWRVASNCFRDRVGLLPVSWVLKALQTWLKGGHCSFSPAPFCFLFPFA